MGCLFASILKIEPIGVYEHISFIYILVALTGVLWAVKESNLHRLDRPSLLFVHCITFKCLNVVE